MPELPEVETVRRGLEHEVSGFTVVGIEVFDSRALRRNRFEEREFLKELVGQRLNLFKRRGKFLWIPLSNSRCLVAHLGMSGQILVRNPNYPLEKSERVRFQVERDRSTLEIRFIDQRLFGGLYVDTLVENSEQDNVPASASHIALDPLDHCFDPEKVASVMHRRKAGIKSLLLNQEIVSGIGNIYADETLWKAKTHFLTPGQDLSTKEIVKILSMSQEVLSNALKNNGTSFDQQYKNVNGLGGSYSQFLNAYGQTGKPCSRCKTLIVRQAWSNRGSHFCPLCQQPKMQS
jgi:formamidopyrimidine-DNA glycosylase